MRLHHALPQRYVLAFRDTFHQHAHDLGVIGWARLGEENSPML